jgi:hypothetical protein
VGFGTVAVLLMLSMSRRYPTVKSPCAETFERVGNDG